MTNNVVNNIQNIFRKIYIVAKASGRKSETINIVAVSKMKSIFHIRKAYSAGILHFGENYLQEAIYKQNKLIDLPLNWHFIGAIQSNKTSLIAKYFQWVHSVDRVKIAQRLSEQRPNNLPPLNICIQVNINNEINKSGCNCQELENIVKIINNLPNLKLRGLMIMPKQSNKKYIQRRIFSQLKHIMQSLSLNLDTLSMGTSHDFESAIYEGATFIRIGKGIFGK